jgi:hypothetical protein
VNCARRELADPVFYDASDIEDLRLVGNGGGSQDVEKGLQSWKRFRGRNKREISNRGHTRFCGR